MDLFKTFLLVVSAFSLAVAQEQKPFLFVTLEATAEELVVLSADTVWGSDRPLRGELPRQFSYALVRDGGATALQGSVPPPPDLKADVASPDGSLTPVARPKVQWSFRVPLAEGVSELQLFHTPPAKGEGKANAAPALVRPIATFSLQKGGQK